LPARITVREAAHPVPDAAGLAATREMLGVLQGLTADDLVLCLMSGGASALLTAPADGLTLEDKQRINRELLLSGANIGEMNCVRKHLSQIKGGRLAAACAPARLVTLAISDVPGDDPAVIGSGPSVPDPTTCADALEILGRYRIDVPAPLRQRLESGALESPKPGDAAFATARFEMVAAPMASLKAAAEAARAAGLVVHVLGDDLEGESREVGRAHAELALAALRGRGSHPRLGDERVGVPCLILSGGETTVTVRPQPSGTPRGRGGRAGEFCLGLAQTLEDAAQAQAPEAPQAAGSPPGGNGRSERPAIWALAADTDGIDGVEDNAGAWVGPPLLARAQAQGLSIDAHQARNDAYGFFSAADGLVVTGPTFTNVNDFRAVLVLAQP
jgi:hydroxypyruvate reductase